MKKGDMAFFYHSNCKEPGIVGIMEIVQEHSPDCKILPCRPPRPTRLRDMALFNSRPCLAVSAHDPKAPYYDPKSKQSDPKWSVVHVEFRRKFKVPITLKELREMGTAGPLENMQLLKQSRLSVSRVRAEEWEHLLHVQKTRPRLSRYLLLDTHNITCFLAVLHARSSLLCASSRTI